MPTKRALNIQSAEVLIFHVNGIERLRFDNLGRFYLRGEIVKEADALSVFHGLRELVAEDKKDRHKMTQRANNLADECQLLKEENKRLHESLSRAERSLENERALRDRKRPR